MFSPFRSCFHLSFRFYFCIILAVIDTHQTLQGALRGVVGDVSQSWRDAFLRSVETLASNEMERALGQHIRSFITAVSNEAVGDAILAHLRALPGNPSTSWVQALREAMNAVPLPVTDAPSSVGATHGSNSSRDTVSTLSSDSSSGSSSDPARD